MIYGDNGTRDIGLWNREKLVKICSTIEGAFSLKNFNEFETLLDDAKSYITADDLKARYDILEVLLKSCPNYGNKINVDNLAKALLIDTLPVESLSADKLAYDHAFYEAIESYLNENLVKLKDQFGKSCYLLLLFLILIFLKIDYILYVSR